MIQARTFFKSFENAVIDFKMHDDKHLKSYNEIFNTKNIDCFEFTNIFSDFIYNNTKYKQTQYVICYYRDNYRNFWIKGKGIHCFMIYGKSEVWYLPEYVNQIMYGFNKNSSFNFLLKNFIYEWNGKFNDYANIILYELNKNKPLNLNNNISYNELFNYIENKPKINIKTIINEGEIKYE